MLTKLPFPMSCNSWAYQTVSRPHYPPHSPLTVPPHCPPSLSPLTVPPHCPPYCSPHCSPSLSPLTVPPHCPPSLFPLTVPPHCSPSLFPLTVPLTAPFTVPPSSLSQFSLYTHSLYAFMNIMCLQACVHSSQWVHTCHSHWHVHACT